MKWPLSFSLSPGMRSDFYSISKSMHLAANALLFSFCSSCLTHPFFKKLSFFLKMCSPPSVGSIILKAASMKNHEKRPFRTPVWGEKSHFGATYCAWKFAKSIVKMCISCLWRLLGVSFACNLLFHHCILHPS